MSDTANRRHILCPGCHRPVFANEEGATSCIFCGTNFDGSPVAEADRDNARAKVRKPGYTPEGLSATEIPAATGYGSDLTHRRSAEAKGDLRLVWDGAVHKRNMVAELFPVALAGAMALAFFPEASLMAKLALALGAAGLVYLVVMALVSESLRQYFEVSADELLVREGAVWSEVKERISADEVEQIYVIRFARGQQPDRSLYELRCRLAGGDVVSLCRDLHSLEQALWIEYQIERHLGVIDVPVEGEVARASA